MKDLYADFIRSRAPNESTVENHYRFDIFIIAIDQQAQELNSRFSEQVTELLILCTSKRIQVIHSVHSTLIKCAL
jgi:hypothetical protein